MKKADLYLYSAVAAVFAVMAATGVSVYSEGTEANRNHMTSVKTAKGKIDYTGNANSECNYQHKPNC